MNQNGTYTNPDPFLAEENPIDLRLIIYKYLLRYWYLYVLGLMIALSIAYVRLRYTTKQYQVRGTILIKSPEASETVSQEALLGELGLAPNNKNVQNEIQILKSRTLMREAIERLNAQVIYELEGRVVNSELYLGSPVLVDTFRLSPGVTSFNIEAKKIDQNRFAILKGEDVVKEVVYGDTLQDNRGMFVFRANEEANWGDNKLVIRFRDPEDIAQSYANRLGARIVGEWSSTLELSLKDRVPEKAADIINTLIDVYNEAAVKDKNRSAENTYEFINERLRLLTAELSEAEGEVERFKTRNVIPTDITSNVGTYLQEFTANDNELSTLQLQQTILIDLEQRLTSDLASYELLPLNTVVESASLIGQLTNYNELLQERQRQLMTLQENHPRITQIDDQIAAAKVVILSTLRNAEKNLERSINALESKNKELQARLRSIPSVERDLIEITRQKNIKENLYLFLLQKREETAISMAVTVSNARVIDPAKPEPKPVEPNPNLYYAIALLLGLGIPFGFIVVSDLMNDTIQTPDDVKNNTKAPLLGSVGYSTAESNIVVSSTSRSAVAEMFRMLRTNLQFMNTGQETQRILVTSNASGEGKTFVTINLGMSLAISGKRTVLVSLDLRKPKLGKYLEEDEKIRGITTYLIGEVTKESIIQSSKLHENLFFIPSGPIPPNPAELILQERTDELFDYLREHFDCILIDTPPVGLVSDALLLSNHATTSLFITRFAQTKKGVLRMVDDLYRDKKLPRLSVILNGVKASRSRYGYNYGYGGYGYGGYGYGYGYYEEESKRGKRKKSSKVKK